MLLGLILFGIAGIVVFHSFPAIVYLLVWYELIVTGFFICEKIERR